MTDDPTTSAPAPYDPAEPDPPADTPPTDEEIKASSEEDLTIPEIDQALSESKYDMEYFYVPLSAMNPAPYNPRVISDENLERLEQSMNDYGLVQPLVWNKRTGYLVGGHQRFKILQKRGVKEIKVCVVDLDETDEKALNLTLNNPAVSGHFTGKQLKQVILDIAKGGKKRSDMRRLGLKRLEGQTALFEGLDIVEEAANAQDNQDGENESTTTTEEIEAEAIDLSYIAPSLRLLAVPCSSLKPDKNNVRTHDDRNRLTVRNSLSKFGQLRPIVIAKGKGERYGTILAGHCTWEETKSLGRSHIAAVNVSHLSVPEMVAFGIVDNKSGELASTDYKKLGDVFRQMDTDWLPFTGYTDYEVSPLLEAEWKPPAPTADEDLAEMTTHGHGLHLTDAAALLLKSTVEAVGSTDASEAVKVICGHFLTCAQVPRVTRGVEPKPEPQPEPEPESGSPPVDN